MTASAPWPTRLAYRRSDRILHVAFEDGSVCDLPAELLRVESPSAEVQGHGAATKTTVPGKRNVSVIGMEPVGQYAVRLVFDDGHDTGLFTWSYLHRLGREMDSIWAAYEARLVQQGLSRDP